MSVVRSWLADVRADRRARWAATLAGIVVGLTVAWVHWLGFVLGGALVGLAATDAKRALAAGLGFGLLAWGVFAGLLAANGALAGYFAMGRLLYLSVGIPVVGALLGSLVRAVA
jgi:hypothetical protein